MKQDSQRKVIPYNRIPKAKGESQETDSSPNWPFSISLCEFPNLLLTGSIVMSKIVNVEPKFKAFVTFLSVSF